MLQILKGDIFNRQNDHEGKRALLEALRTLVSMPLSQSFAVRLVKVRSNVRSVELASMVPYVIRTWREIRKIALECCLTAEAAYYRL